jgi:hypothetical protein
MAGLRMPSTNSVQATPPPLWQLFCPHLPTIQHNAAVCEGRAVQSECLILATLTTHVAAKPVPQPVQVRLQLAYTLAKVLVRVQAQCSNLHTSTDGDPETGGGVLRHK